MPQLDDNCSCIQGTSWNLLIVLSGNTWPVGRRHCSGGRGERPGKLECLLTLSTSKGGAADLS